MSVESKHFAPIRAKVRSYIREYIEYIPEDKVFQFNYKFLKGTAKRQLNRYLHKISLQKSMKRVYIFEINKLILNEALTFVVRVMNLKFTKIGRKS